MHAGMQYDLIQGQGHEPPKVGIDHFQRPSPPPLGGWQMTTDSKLWHNT